jgi:hypothetical protein
LRKRSKEQIEAHKKKYHLGEYRNLYNQDAAKWCIDRGYKIYPVPVERCSPKCYKFKLVIEYKGLTQIGTKIYTDKEWSDAVWGTYNYLYKKNGKKAKAI